MNCICEYCQKEFRSPRSLQVHLQACRVFLGESRYLEYCKSRSRTKTEDQKSELSKRYSGEGNPFYGKRHSDHTKKLISDTRSNRIWINNGNSELIINRTELESYLKSGYVTGRLESSISNFLKSAASNMKGKIWISKNDSEIIIDNLELPKYQILGYQIGRSNATKSKASRTRIKNILKGSYRMPYNGIRSCKSFLYGDLLKSSYEFIYAVWLRSQGISYKYESMKFLLSTGSSYTPDFYLEDSNTIVEIKGRNDKIMLNKLEICRDAVESNGYSYVVIFGDLIWSKYYYDLVNIGYNISESLEILRKNNSDKKINPDIPYIDWVIDDKSIQRKEVIPYEEG